MSPTEASSRGQTALVVLDGASEPVRAGEATSLETAATPALDTLVGEGELLRVATIPPGMAPGTEVGLPRLLGVQLSHPPSRGRVEAAAAGIDVGDDEGAWRLDVVGLEEVPAPLVRAIDSAVRPLGGRVHPLRGHRLLLLGPSRWGDAPLGPHQTEGALGDQAGGAFDAVIAAAAAAVAAAGGPGVAWPWGRLGAPGELADLGGRLGRVVLVTAGGAAAGLGRLLGADVIRAVGRRATAAAVDALLSGVDVVVLHREDPDEAGHARDAAGKAAAITAADREAVAPLAELAHRRGFDLIVTADHGCDPADGRHTAAPVPAVCWTADALPISGTTGRLTERATAQAPLLEPERLIPRAAALGSVPDSSLSPSPSPRRLGHRPAPATAATELEYVSPVRGTRERKGRGGIGPGGAGLRGTALGGAGRVHPPGGWR